MSFSTKNVNININIVKQSSFTQKSNIENISPRNLTNPQSRTNSFVEPKSAMVKTGLFGNIQSQNTYHLNIK